MEAYLAGCYPVVANTSAQGEIVRLAGGSAVPVTTMEELIAGLADAVLWCHAHREELGTIAEHSVQTVAEYFASSRYDRVIEDAYNTAIKGSRNRMR